MEFYNCAMKNIPIINEHIKLHNCCLSDETIEDNKDSIKEELISL